MALTSSVFNNSVATNLWLTPGAAYISISFFDLTFVEESILVISGFVLAGREKLSPALRLTTFSPRLGCLYSPLLACVKLKPGSKRNFEFSFKCQNHLNCTNEFTCEPMAMFLWLVRMSKHLVRYVAPQLRRI